MYAHVAVQAGDQSIDQPFTYLLPPSCMAQPGQCVVAPFRGRQELGYILAITQEPEIPLDLRQKDRPGPSPLEWKTITEVLDTPPVFDRITAGLLCWIAREYVCGMSDALRCVIPPYRLASIRTRVRLPVLDPAPAEEAFNTEHEASSPLSLFPPPMEEPSSRVSPQGSSRQSSPLARRVLETLREVGGEADLEQLQQVIRTPRLAVAVRQLAQRGKVEVLRITEKPASERTVVGIRLNASQTEIDQWLQAHQGRRHARQREILEHLAVHGHQPVPQAELLRQLGCSLNPIKALLEAGLLERVPVAVRRNPWPPSNQIPLGLSLTPDQANALDTILEAVQGAAARPRLAPLAVDTPDTPAALAGAPRPPLVLLRGVTGSGKTEVYLRAMEEARRLGRQSIALVPEISLTVQMVGIFQGRFPSRVAVLHSKLSEGERLDEWERIRRGEVDVVIGARSALFAPVPDLGLIVLDEEHETSYKQDSSPRYLTRDTAAERARLAGACLVLSSATPSLEAAWMAEQGIAHLAHLPRRIDDRPLPGVILIDQRRELKENPGHLFSRRLQEALRLRLEKGEQAILFLNRRGFATITLCRECGFVARCRNCAISLTYYVSSRLLRCHHCEFTMAAPDICPKCAGLNIRQFGIGTERVEQELSSLFPGARIGRMDTDSMSRKGAFQELVESFRRAETDILIGTQMVAKGFDFPGVTLVGVISADTMLNLPDFRASERTFQLLTQVSGRAGRGSLPGDVIVQTFNPEHYAIQAAARHDFDEFYEQELPTRREAHYPPFVRLANLIIEGFTREETRERAARAAEALRQAIGDHPVELLGPAPAPLTRIRGHFRWHILLKARDGGHLRDACRLMRLSLRSEDLREISIDLDPMSLL